MDDAIDLRPVLARLRAGVLAPLEGQVQWLITGCVDVDGDLWGTRSLNGEPANWNRPFVRLEYFPASGAGPELLALNVCGEFVKLDPQTGEIVPAHRRRVTRPKLTAALARFGTDDEDDEDDDEDGEDW